MQKILKKMLVGAGLIAGLATSAQAQYLTDAGSPLGGGGGASGSVVNYLSEGAGIFGLSDYFNATAVADPRGGAPMPVNSALRSAFLVAANAAGAAGLVTALGGGPAAQAFANSVNAFASNFTTQGALAVVQAYNALVDSPSVSVEALATVRAGVVALLHLKQ